MEFEDLFKDFCNLNGYNSKIEYNNQEYSFIISKGDDNCGIFMTIDELIAMDSIEAENLLQLLDKGFKQRFNK